MMCAIFGVLDFKDRLNQSQRLAIFRELANAAQVRGTDASGVAYVQNGTIQIQKAPRPAHRMHWRIGSEARYLMGHTRMTTQGTASKNYNNHPFPGKAGNQSFALAHNGVLNNDSELRYEHRLPSTKIETDSYVAVQLLEKYGKLCPDTLRQIAESLNGSFTISVLDNSNNLYLIKGNNPLTIRLLPELGCYLYASTGEILDRALAGLRLSKVPQIDIPISQGDIMTINQKGTRTVTSFDITHLIPHQYFFNWGPYFSVPASLESNVENEYLKAVLEYGRHHGIPEQELRLLLDAGYDVFDLEQLIYDDEFRAGCVQEIMADFGVW